MGERRVKREREVCVCASVCVNMYDTVSQLGSVTTVVLLKFVKCTLHEP